MNKGKVNDVIFFSVFFVFTGWFSVGSRLRFGFFFSEVYGFLVSIFFFFVFFIWSF